MLTAASFLFVPGDRPELFEKALTSGADEVIVDLEDGVGRNAKVTARDGLVGRVLSRLALLRINPIGSEYHASDLKIVEALSWVEGVILPKVERPDDVKDCLAVLPKRMPLMALVETALGVERVEQIARSGASRIMFGNVDFSTDIGVTPNQDVLCYPRTRLVIASRSAGLPPPVDGPCLAIDDVDEVMRDALGARRLGMAGKLCIHPSQIGPVSEVFCGSKVELAWAQSLLMAASTESGAFRFDGQMVDEPVLARARRVVERANREHSRVAPAVEPDSG